MLYAIAHFFWPTLSDKEIRKFGLLGFIVLCIIGCFWLLGIVKDVIFFKIAFPESFGWNACQGRLFQPIAKTFSPFILFICILIYSKLVDTFEKHKLFYILGSFYLLIFATVATLLGVRAFSGDLALGKTVLAIVGWLIYFTVESFGSIMAALFWSFAVSITDSGAAKQGFPLMISTAQFGALVGSALGLSCEFIGGVWSLLIICCCAVTAMMLLVRYFMRTTPEEEMIGNVVACRAEKEHKEHGYLDSFFGGLRLLLTRPYLAGVLVCSTIFEVINTIIEYQMKSAADIYPAFIGEAGFTRFLSIFGVVTNCFALALALVGTSFFIKRFGLRFCLLLYPIVLGVVLIGLFGLYTFTVPTAAHILWATFGAMVLTKAFNYTINSPTRDMMYIPTSKDAKFKAKGWVEMFGGRSVKLVGARVTNALKYNMMTLINFGTLLSLGLVGFWIVVAIYVGNKNAELIRDNKIVE